MTAERSRSVAELREEAERLLHEARVKEHEEKVTEAQRRLAAGVSDATTAATAAFGVFKTAINWKDADPAGSLDAIECDEADRGDAWTAVRSFIESVGIKTTKHHTCCGDFWGENCPECGDICDGEYCSWSTKDPRTKVEQFDWKQFKALAKQTFGEDQYAYVLGWD